jgi:hypothetical protein
MDRTYVLFHKYTAYYIGASMTFSNEESRRHASQANPKTKMRSRHKFEQEVYNFEQKHAHFAP